MTAEEHPDYNQEKQHLNHTCRCIQDYIERHTPAVGYGGDNKAAQESRRVILKRVEEMKQAQKQPYFGRVDWLESDNIDPETFYIGRFAIYDANVYSWADNLAADLYYQQKSDRAAGKLLLKRTLDISHDELQAIYDEYVDPILEEIFQRAVDRFTDAMLLGLLRDSRSGRLHDIVATIQKQQYHIIQSPKDQLLVVQGVTGSGKTAVALHRVAYLLYQHRDSPDFSTNRIMILGPNRIFLSYIAGVLPTLGERQIPQNTFTAWILDMLDTPVVHEPQDISLEILLDSTPSLAEKAMRYRNARNKGSLKMAQLLDRYVDILHDEVLNNRESLVCTFRVRRRGNGQTSEVSLKTERTMDDLGKVMDQVRDLPFNTRRDEAKSRLVRTISQELTSQLKVNAFERSQLRSEIEQSVEAQIDQYFSDWRSQNVSVAYRRLLRRPELLRQAGEGIYSDWDLELLTQDAPTALTPFRFSDLAALLYLKIRLDGTGDIFYDHIVIDEAQDITPLHFKVLHEYSRGGSMTVLGDLAQGIYPYHGVNAWEELAKAVGEQSIVTETIKHSYRSTQEIIEFANAMFRRVGVGEDQLAEPIARPGPNPSLRQFQNFPDLVLGLPKIVHSEQSEGKRSIAMICKTVAGCKDLATELAVAGFNDYQLIDDRDAHYLGQTAIIPSYLTKGLEFDTVIVTDADAETYAPDELNISLLYVAITRAAHSLHICWTGNLTPLLDETVSSVEVQTTLSGNLLPHPLTVEDYVAKNPHLDVDWCIERLSAADKLRLLHNGKIDETVLEILLRSFVLSQQRPSDEAPIEPLDSLVQNQLRQQVSELEATPARPVQEALGFAQLTYGLLRNQMRSVGLQLPDVEDSTLIEQIIPMVSLLKAIKEDGLPLSAGRWTTQQRSIQMVDESRQPIAESQLALLMDYGVVEESGRAQRSQIRVPQEWIRGLLELSLGHRPKDWDQDLLDQIMSLPQPLYWNATMEAN